MDGFNAFREGEEQLNAEDLDQAEVSSGLRQG
jgi:hypothetical protein